GPIAVRVPRKVPVGEYFSRYEAPRGEAILYLRGNGTEKPDRVKVRAPTLANLVSIRHTLLNQQLADIPIIVAAIDPCLSCTDRVVLLQQVGAREGEILHWAELRRISLRQHVLAKKL
ncbi:MAG: NADH dehydrogenase subunit, partial [bacterium]